METIRVFHTNQANGFRTVMVWSRRGPTETSTI
jgi:hypothetical protein